MTVEVRWAQREVLVRLLRDGQVRVSRQRRGETDVLLGLGWVQARPRSTSILVPSPDRIGDLSRRLAYVWPDWREEVEAAVARGADPYSAGAYVRDVRTVVIELDDVPIDGTTRLVLDSAFAELSRSEGGVRLRIVRVQGSRLSVEITDPSPPSQAAFEVRVERLERRLKEVTEQVRLQNGVMADLRSMLGKARDHVLLGGPLPVQGPANVLLLAVQGFDELDDGRAEVIAALVRSIMATLDAGSRGALVGVTPHGPLVAAAGADVIAEASFRARDVLRSLGLPTSVAVGRGDVEMRRTDCGTDLVDAGSGCVARLRRLALDDEEVFATEDFVSSPDLDSSRFRIAMAPGRVSTESEPIFVLKRLGNL